MPPTLLLLEVTVVCTRCHVKIELEVYSTTQVSGKIAAETGGFRRRFKRQSALP
jgi:hypothetical protein